MKCPNCGTFLDISADRFLCLECGWASTEEPKPTPCECCAQDDAINPAHYRAGGLEVIAVIEAFGLNYRLGNAVKYILRAGKKDHTRTAEDLQKAAWYIARELEKMRG